MSETCETCRYWTGYLSNEVFTMGGWCSNPNNYVVNMQTGSVTARPTSETESCPEHKARTND